jgi:magnesium and cobalt exporter, CNNM family
MLAAWTIICGLIAVNAFYVAAEFGAVSARRSRLRRLSEDGNRRAARVLAIVEHGDQLYRYIAASQLGITLSSLILGAYGRARLSGALAPWLVAAGADPVRADSLAAVVVLCILTIMGVLLGELVPKLIALQHPTAVALGVVTPMRWSLRVFAPFIAILNGSGVLVQRLIGVRSTGHRHIHSPEEIDLLIAESRDGGLLEPEEQVRLHRALKLGLSTAKQLMVPRSAMAAISADLPFPRVLEAVITSPYTRLPVYKGSLDNIVGLVRTKDVVLHYIEKGDKGTISALVRSIARVREDLPADRLLSSLREQRCHQALVTDPRGRVVGLITLEDVLAHLLGRSPEELRPTASARGNQRG